MSFIVILVYSYRFPLLFLELKRIYQHVMMNFYNKACEICVKVQVDLATAKRKDT